MSVTPGASSLAMLHELMASRVAAIAGGLQQLGIALPHDLKPLIRVACDPQATRPVAWRVYELILYATKADKLDLRLAKSLHMKATAEAVVRDRGLAQQVERAADANELKITKGSAGSGLGGTRPTSATGDNDPLTAIADPFAGLPAALRAIGTDAALIEHIRELKAATGGKGWRPLQDRMVELDPHNFWSKSTLSGKFGDNCGPRLKTKLTDEGRITNLFQALIDLAPTAALATADQYTALWRLLVQHDGDIRKLLDQSAAPEPAADDTNTKNPVPTEEPPSDDGVHRLLWAREAELAAALAERDDLQAGQERLASQLSTKDSELAEANAALESVKASRSRAERVHERRNAELRDQLVRTGAARDQAAAAEQDQRQVLAMMLADLAAAGMLPLAMTCYNPAVVGMATVGLSELTSMEFCPTSTPEARRFAAYLRAHLALARHAALADDPAGVGVSMAAISATGVFHEHFELMLRAQLLPTTEQFEGLASVCPPLRVHGPQLLEQARGEELVERFKQPVAAGGDRSSDLFAAEAPETHEKHGDEPPARRSEQRTVAELIAEHRPQLVLSRRKRRDQAENAPPAETVEAAGARPFARGLKVGAAIVLVGGAVLATVLLSSSDTGSDSVQDTVVDTAPTTAPAAVGASPSLVATPFAVVHGVQPVRADGANRDDHIRGTGPVYRWTLPPRSAPVTTTFVINVIEAIGPGGGVGDGPTAVQLTGYLTSRHPAGCVPVLGVELQTENESVGVAVVYDQPVNLALSRFTHPLGRRFTVTVYRVDDVPCPITLDWAEAGVVTR